MYPLQGVPQEVRMSAMRSPELVVVPEHARASALLLAATSNRRSAECRRVRHRG